MTLSRTQIYSGALLYALLFLTVSGCASLPTFPFPEATIIKTQQDFAQLTSRPMQSQDNDVQLAGRIISVETTRKGVTFLAHWLPFPKDAFSGPETRSFEMTNQRFSMDFSGNVDDDGKRQGNEFLMLGKLTGTRDMVTLQGITKSIPYFTVQCLHVWKTAGTDLQEFIWMDPRDESYPPPLEDTYCAPAITS